MHRPGVVGTLALVHASIYDLESRHLAINAQSVPLSGGHTTHITRTLDAARNDGPVVSGAMAA